MRHPIDGLRIALAKLWPLGAIAAAALASLVFVLPPSVGAEEKDGTSVSLVGEVLAVRNEAGKITQVRLIKADGRYLRVELDGQGAFLGVRHSGSFVEVVGQLYLKQNGADQIRWIRVKRFRTVPRPPDWIEPELICHEVEAEPDSIADEDGEDAGVADEADR